jgi:hypothetical protein
MCTGKSIKALVFGQQMERFFGGFILLYGAKMAGGCTGGHILSGSMQCKKQFIFCCICIYSIFINRKIILLQGEINKWG